VLLKVKNEEYTFPIVAIKTKSEEMQFKKYVIT